MADKDEHATEVAGNTATGEPKILRVDDDGILQVTEG